MAYNEQQKTLTLGLAKRRSNEIEGEEEDEEEREIEELEREVKEMAEVILESRRTIPDRILEAVSCQLVAQRPKLSLIRSDPSISSSLDCNGEVATSGDPRKELQEYSKLNEGASLTGADPEMLEKIKIFRAKAASNIAAMPVILKRMNDCVARIDRIEQYNLNIHSVFKKKTETVT